MIFASKSEKKIELACRCLVNIKRLGRLCRSHHDKYGETHPGGWQEDQNDDAARGYNNTQH